MVMKPRYPLLLISDYDNFAIFPFNESAMMFLPASSRLAPSQATTVGAGNKESMQYCQKRNKFYGETKFAVSHKVEVNRINFQLFSEALEDQSRTGFLRGGRNLALVEQY
jgi:hypothetical protein